MRNPQVGRGAEQTILPVSKRWPRMLDNSDAGQHRAHTHQFTQTFGAETNYNHTSGSTGCAAGNINAPFADGQRAIRLSATSAQVESAGTLERHAGRRVNYSLQPGGRSCLPTTRGFKFTERRGRTVQPARQTATTWRPNGDRPSASPAICARRNRQHDGDEEHPARIDGHGARGPRVQHHDRARRQLRHGVHRPPCRRAGAQQRNVKGDVGRERARELRVHFAASHGGRPRCS